MDVLTDGLLLAATLFAGGYCWVLARRVRDLKSLDKGLGGAIVTLTRQVELARTTLEEAQAATRGRREELDQLIARADSAAGALKLALAGARHVVPEPRSEAEAAPDEASDLAKIVEQGAEKVEPSGADPAELGLPKPRVLPPIGNPLRRREPVQPIRSEEDLMAALTDLAAGGAR